MLNPFLAGAADNAADANNALLTSAVSEKSASLIFGLFMGVMLTASAYLFFIWVVMRDRGQIFLLSSCCASAQYRQHQRSADEQSAFTTVLRGLSGELQPDPVLHFRRCFSPIIFSNSTSTAPNSLALLSPV